MSKLILKNNGKDGDFLIRKTPVLGLPSNMKDNGLELIEVLLIRYNKNDQVACYFDFDDFKHVFKCTHFEFLYELRAWLNIMNVDNDQWVRVDIMVPTNQ